MDTVEFFSGTGSFSRIAKDRGFSTYTIDNDPYFVPDLCIDILNIRQEMYDRKINILWCSPPCQTFSVASIGKHWSIEGDRRIPKTKNAEHGLLLLDFTIRFISLNRPDIWFIENPRGMMRKIIDPIFSKYGVSGYKRETVTYCRYGDKRMKPTDIWTNCLDWNPRPMCKNGDTCHETAPRGSPTGTQGLEKHDRGVIPPELIKEIMDVCERTDKHGC